MTIKSYTKCNYRAVTLDEMRKNFSALIHEVARSMNKIVLIKRGVPLAVASAAELEYRQHPENIPNYIQIISLKTARTRFTGMIETAISTQQELILTDYSEPIVHISPLTIAQRRHFIKLFKLNTGGILW